MLTPDRRKVIIEMDAEHWGWLYTAGLAHVEEFSRGIPFAEVTPPPPVLNAEGLRECGWCGSNESTVWQSHKSRYFAMCVEDDCGAHGPDAETRDEAKAKWNSRPTVAAPANAMEIVRLLQARADELGKLCDTHPRESEAWYRASGAACALNNIANEIGSQFVSELAAPAVSEAEELLDWLDRHATLIETSDQVDLFRLDKDLRFAIRAARKAQEQGK